MATTTADTAGSFSLESAGAGAETLTLSGRLDVNSTGAMWQDALGLLERTKPATLVVNAARVDYCDAAGIALLLAVRRHQTRAGGTCTIQGLPDRFQRLLDLFETAEVEGAGWPEPESRHIFEELGRASHKIWTDFRTLVAFVGELTVALAEAAKRPGQIRWRDAAMTAERAGVDALPIIALLGFLLGLIMAFQAAIPMRQFGADIYVANLIGLSMIRELGPLLTAIILAGRSGSAFAAELGTMKVKEEIDALVTMGLGPVRFLVVPRVLATVAMTPLLAIFANLFGLVGGLVVMLSLGFSFEVFKNQVLSAVTAGDLVGGLFKATVFGIVVAGIGCLRGLQTTTGASAVGEATTRAVVSGLVLITVVDGVFAVLFYALGW